MNDNNEKLFNLALASQKNAYVPYSDYPVGCSIKTVDGEYFSGCNVELANYKGTCAEAGAIAAMINAGQSMVSEIAVVGPNKKLCTPCGDCRQRIFEFSSNDTKILAFNNQGELMKTYKIKDLLPDSFGPKDLIVNKT